MHCTVNAPPLKLRCYTNLINKLSCRWDRRTLPPEPCHRCRTLPPPYSISRSLKVIRNCLPTIISLHFVVVFVSYIHNCCHLQKKHKSVHCGPNCCVVARQRQDCVMFEKTNTVHIYTNRNMCLICSLHHQNELCIQQNAWSVSTLCCGSLPLQLLA